MHKRRLSGLLAFPLLLPRAATAQTEAVFQPSESADWATGWIESIFRGADLPADLSPFATHIGNLTALLRHVLWYYSLGMLVLAGFLLAIRVVTMVAETAHSGVVMGKKANQLWTPLRFALALALLVPIGTGLNAGQWLVVKLAESGSTLASNAWRGVTDTMKDSFARLAVPQSPDTARLVAVALEMETCRSLYHQIFVSLMPDPALAIAGDILSLRRIPATRLMPETWRYSNNLHAAYPLCGEYRFAYRAAGAKTDDVETYARAIGDFAHAATERVIVHARLRAEQHSASFLAGQTPVNADIADHLATAAQNERNEADAKIIALMKEKARVSVSDSFAGAGWITAGAFLTDLLRRQSSYGSLTAEAVPTAQTPLFGHNALSRAMLADALANDAILRGMSNAQLEKVFVLYDKVATAMQLARGWIYEQPGADLVLPDQFDVRDQISPASDGESGRALFTRLLNAATFAYGIGAGNGTSLARDTANNPLTAMAETGRRALALGNWMTGMLGPALAEPAYLGSALLFALAAFGLGAAGLILLFLVPLLPFFRFFLGVLAWFAEVLEAVIALPLVALAHLDATGEGFASVKARKAYWLWLGVFMRPALTLFGFAVGLLLFVVALTLLNVIFIHATNALWGSTGDTLVGLRVMSVLLYALGVLAVANVSFRSIALVPDRALHWIGSDDNSSTAAATTAPATVAGQTGIAPAAIGHGHALIGEPTVASSDNLPATTGRPAPSAHSLKSALIPLVREKNFAATEETPAGTQTITGSSSHASSGTAIAAAYAHASATAKQMPPDKEKGRFTEIAKAVEKLADTVNQRQSPHDPVDPLKSDKPLNDPKTQQSEPPVPDDKQK